MISMYLIVYFVLSVFAGAVLAGKRPHILLIVADDYGYGDVGYHGSAIRTPNIDRLAYSGVRLENYYVQPICTPSRSQLLSGRYQIHTGLQHSIIWAPQPNALPKELPTMADLLRAQGYATHIVGKWHLGFYKEEYEPTNRGFDSFFGYLTGSEFYYNHTYCFNNESQTCGLDFRQNKKIFTSNEYSTFLYSRRAEEIVKEHASLNEDRPLFLYLPFQAVHAPLQVPPEYEAKYDFINDKDRRTYADNGGQVHEGGNNWPLRGWKGGLFEGGVKGVGFVHSSRLQQAGGVSTDLIHISDWLPTLLAQAGGNTSGLKLDGFNQWETISEGASGPRIELLHNIDPLSNHRGDKTSQVFDNRVRSALRVGDWKLITGNPSEGSWVPPPETGAPWIIDPSPRSENIWLFNIMKDPYETTNVAKENPQVVSSMLQKLAAYNATAVPPFYPPYDPRSYPSHNGGVWGPWE